MSVLFAFALFPVFFIIIYAAGEYLFPTKNGATVFAVFAALTVTVLYYLIRQKAKDANKKKKETNDREQLLMYRLALLDSEKFNSLFPENSLCDNSLNGVNEEKTVEFLRKGTCDGKITVYSLNGMTKGATDLLNLLGIDYRIYSGKDLFSAAENINLPDIAYLRNLTRTDRFLRKITDRPFISFAVKYGLILVLLSFFSPYGTYYAVFGGILFSYGVFIYFYRKKR